MQPRQDMVRYVRSPGATNCLMATLCKLNYHVYGTESKLNNAVLFCSLILTFYNDFLKYFL